MDLCEKKVFPRVLLGALGNKIYKYSFMRRKVVETWTIPEIPPAEPFYQHYLDLKSIFRDPFSSAFYVTYVRKRNDSGLCSFTKFLERFGSPREGKNRVQFSC